MKELIENGIPYTKDDSILDTQIKFLQMEVDYFLEMYNQWRVRVENRNDAIDLAEIEVLGQEIK